MWVFLTLHGLGFAFMLYAVVQFHGELKEPRRWRALEERPGTVLGGPVLEIKPKFVRIGCRQTGITGWSDGNGQIQFRFSCVMRMSVESAVSQIKRITEWRKEIGLLEQSP